MDPKVVVGILSLCGSVIAAIIASVQALRTARLASAANLEVEKFRRDSERRLQAFKVATDESQPVLLALETAWADIQTAKDMLSAFLTDHEKPEVILNGLGDAEASLTDGYRHFGMRLSDDGRKAWHAARGLVATVRPLLARSGGTPEGVNVGEIATDVRVRLTDWQMVLAEERSNVRHRAALLALDLL